MKRVFNVMVFGDGFKDRAEYARIVIAHGGDPAEGLQTLRGPEERLGILRKDLIAAGLLEVSNAEEEDVNRFYVSWEMEPEASDWHEADAFVLTGTSAYLADNVNALSKADVRIDVSDEGLWEIKDEAIELLCGNAPALFTSVKGLLLANEALRSLVVASSLQGFEFVDGVKIEGENASRVKQKLWIFDSNVKLPAMEPDVIFENERRQTLANNDIQGLRLWSSETVAKYRRSELDRVGFVDAGEMIEGRRATSLTGGLLISRKAFEFFREAGVPLDCYPALVVV